MHGRDAPGPTMIRLARWLRLGRWRLSSRMVVFSLLLLLGMQLAGFVLIRASIVANAETRLAEELAVAERIWRRLLEQRSVKLTQGASVLAADFAFREAVASN